MRETFVWRCHDMETLAALLYLREGNSLVMVQCLVGCTIELKKNYQRSVILDFCAGKPPVINGFPTPQRASYVQSVPMSWRHHHGTVVWSVKLYVNSHARSLPYEYTCVIKISPNRYVSMLFAKHNFHLISRIALLSIMYDYYAMIFSLEI